MLGAARATPIVLAACMLFLVGGLAEIVVSTLTPLQLDENGLSSGAIGLVFRGWRRSIRDCERDRGPARRTRDDAAGGRHCDGSRRGIARAARSKHIDYGDHPRNRRAHGRHRRRVHDRVPLGATGAASVAVGVGAVSGVLMLASGTSNVIGPLGGAAIASADQ